MVVNAFVLNFVLLNVFLSEAGGTSQSTSMANAKVSCWKCEVPLKNGQNLITCGGLCGSFSHKSCLSENRDSSVGISFCGACTGRSEKKTMTNADINIKLSAMFSVIMESQLQIQALTSEINSLREENRCMRDELLPRNRSDNSNQSPGEPAHAKHPRKTSRKDCENCSGRRAGGMEKCRTSEGNFQRRSLNSRTISRVPGSRNKSGSRERNNDGSPPDRGSRIAAADVNNNNNKQRGRLIKGRSVHVSNHGNNDKLTDKTPQIKKVFVTHVEKSVTAKKMLETVSSWGVKIKCVHRLKSRSRNSASFCLLVSSESFKTVMNPDRWDSEIGFKEFLGSPREDQIEESAYTDRNE